MFRLQRLINKDIFSNNNGNPYLSEAHTCLSRAEIYLLSAQDKAYKLRRQRHKAVVARLRAEKLRIKTARLRAAEAGAQQPIEK